MLTPASWASASSSPCQILSGSTSSGAHSKEGDRRRPLSCFTVNREREIG